LLIAAPALIRRAVVDIFELFKKGNTLTVLEVCQSIGESVFP